MLTLGIIGGMGPEATVAMYKEIIERTDAKKDQEHIDVIIYSHASMPDRTAEIKAGRTKEISELLAADARLLSRAGADVIAIPCNTSHRFIGAIAESVDIPVINMIEETAEYIRLCRPEIKKAGILATDGTIGAGLYRRALEKRGIEAYEPEADIQRLVMKIIYDRIKAGQKGSMEDFAPIDRALRQSGCDGAILACTELSVFRGNNDLGSFYVDAMQVLVERCITVCGGRIRREKI